MVIITSALFLVLIFSFLSGIHFYWGFGGKWGLEYVFPTKEETNAFHIPAIASFIVAFVLLIMGLYFAIMAHFLEIELPFFISKYGSWAITSVFLLRAIGDFKYLGFFKQIKHTKFGKYDSKFYTPLCLLIAFCSMVFCF